MDVSLSKEGVVKDKGLKVSHTAHTTDKGGQYHRKGCRRLGGNQLCLHESEGERTCRQLFMLFTTQHIHCIEERGFSLILLWCFHFRLFFHKSSQTDLLNNVKSYSSMWLLVWLFEAAFST